MSQKTAELIVELVILAIVLVCVNAYYSSACHKQYSSYGTTSYGFVQGCMVKIGDRNIPADTIREVPAGVVAK